MDANNILEELRTLYPEDLNKDYNCYGGGLVIQMDPL